MNTFLAAALAAGAALTLPSPTSLAQLAGPGADHRTVPVAAAPAAVPRQEPKGKKEPHPEIRRAIRALENAKRDLNAAASDFGGHKVEAIKSIDTALEHLRLALNYDKK